jgi:hypothetical protein
LPELAPHGGQQVPLDLAFDPLGDDFEPECPGQLDDALGQSQALPGDSDPVHEGLVHLQHIDRQLPQVAEGRVSGAEVVDRQPHADVLQFPQVVVHPLVAAQQHALGQFEHERPGFQTRLAEDLAHQVDKAGIAELTGRHVHADIKPARGRTAIDDWNGGPLV